jgi:hypothetical protein
MKLVRLVALSVLALAPPLAPVGAQAGDAPRCEGRFAVEGEPLVPGSLAGGADVVSVEGRRVSIASGCKPTRARVRGGAEGARLRVRFESLKQPGTLGGGSFVGDVRDFYDAGGARVSRCEGARGVRLELRIDAACESLTGRLRARSPALDREFVAIRVPE